MAMELDTSSRTKGSLCTFLLPTDRVRHKETELRILCRCASSKHLQTRRFLDTLQGYLIDIQRILIQLHLSANPQPEPFVDHAGVLRDSKTGRAVNGHTENGAYDDADMMRESELLCCCLDVAQLLFHRFQLGIHFLTVAMLNYLDDGSACRHIITQV